MIGSRLIGSTVARAGVLASTLLAAFTLATPLRAAPVVSARHAAAATPHPAATSVATGTLHDGGNALDAAIAAAFTLSVVDPSRASLGGGGLLLWRDATSGAVWALDFRELAPRELSQSDAAAAKVAVPGFVRGLAAAHARFGTRPWKELLVPAIAGARDGVPLTTRVAAQIAAAGERVIHSGGLVATSPETGARLAQPELADTLQSVANDPNAFLTGSDARRLVAALGPLGSTLTVRDLEEWEPRWRAPLRIDTGPLQLYTSGPPSGGGLALASLIDAPLPSAAPDPWIARVSAASLERLRHASDPDANRLALESGANGDAPPSASGESDISGAGIVVVDTHGNAVAMVLTTGSRFGSGIVAPGGYLMNDSLRDFSGAGVNAAASRRRPATSMTPLIVTSGGALRLIVASGGGSTSPSATAQVTFAILNGADPADAVSAPRYHHDGNPATVVLERRDEMFRALTRRFTTSGQAVRDVEAIGDVQAIAVEDGELEALSDPRGGGAAGGY